MGYRIIKQYYEMTLNDTFENNNRGDKSKTIRRGYFMKYFLTILLVINGIFGSVFAQQYPVRLVPVVFPPYNVRLSDYALNSEPKLQLQVLMTDLLEPPHKTGIKFSLESGGRVIAVSTPFVNGLEPFLLQPGNNISLSNLDLKPLLNSKTSQVSVPQTTLEHSLMDYTNTVSKRTTSTLRTTSLKNLVPPFIRYFTSLLSLTYPKKEKK